MPKENNENFGTKGTRLPKSSNVIVSGTTGRSYANLRPVTPPRCYPLALNAEGDSVEAADVMERQEKKEGCRRERAEQ